MIKLVSGLFHNEEQTKAELCQFILSTDRLSIGPECEKFEQAFARFQGRQQCIVFNSGSSANLALVQALLNLNRLKNKDQAAFSAITWATNVMPLIQLGLTPIPVDVEINTLNASSATVQQTLDDHPDIKLLFLTNLLGLCSDIDSIKKLCEKHHIILIEDNCESLGTVYQGIKLGNWSLASTFSFFVGHHMSTIEGGAICTDDQELALMLKLVRAHGWDRNLTEKEKHAIRLEHKIDENFFANFTFYVLGYNLRPTEITGFLGNQQLRYLNDTIEQRAKNFAQFQAASHQNADLVPLRADHIELVSSFAMPVICQDPQKVSQYINAFHQAEVEIRPLVGGSIPDQPFYRKLFGETGGMPNARLLNQQGFYFANHEGITKKEISTLCHVLHSPEPVPA